MIPGGSQYRIQSTADLLSIGGAFATTATSARTLTFQGGGGIIVSNSASIGDGSDPAATVNVVKEGTGTLTFDSFALSYSGTTTVSNGVLNVTTDFYGSGPIIVAGGALGGTASIIISSVTVQPGGAVAPGTSVGTLTIFNNLTNSGDLWIEVDKSLSPGQSNDVLVVSGTLINAGTGTVIVDNLGPALTVGDRFVLFNGQALPNGGAMSVAGGGAIWQNDLAVDGSITVLSTTIPQPTINQPVLSGSNLVLSGTGGPAGSAYSVRSATNAATPLADWTIVGSGTFSGSGAFSITNAISPGEPERFFIISIP